MRINQTAKFGVSFVVTVFLTFLMVGVARAECVFFTGWVDNKDGTVRDPRNGLVWKRCAEGLDFTNGYCAGKEVEVTWSAGMLLAQQSRFLGESDWRLPSKDEFATVLGNFKDCQDNKKGEYAASKAIAYSSSRYWTSSAYHGEADTAWYVDFRYGFFNGGLRVDAYPVRLVRSSQLFGGDISAEFVKEGAVIAEAAERKNRIELMHQNKKLAAFRKALRQGDDTNCGPVIEIKGKLVKVAFAVANYGNEHWIKREQILPPDYSCHFLNGQYQSEQ